jgi:hypothetical protein
MAREHVCQSSGNSLRFIGHERVNETLRKKKRNAIIDDINDMTFVIASTRTRYRLKESRRTRRRWWY